MPKKKQVTFQNSIPGKFIPRNDPPPGSVFRSGANDNRFNAKMAELLASSSSINNENELVSTKSSQDEATTASEITSIESSRVHPNLLHRRIVTMLETLRKPDDESSTLPLISSHTEHKSQPITFGQLRQATISSVPTPIIEDKPTPQQTTIDTEEKHHKRLTSFARDSRPDLTSGTSKFSGKHQINKGRLYYSPSLEQLFEQQNVVSQTKVEEEQQPQKSSLTVDEILAMYYSKANLSINTESHLPSSTYPNPTTGFYIHPSGPRWNSLQTNQHNISPQPPPLVLNEQNRNRLPPPSYSSSVVYSHRTTPTVVPNPAQHLIHPSIPSSLLEHLYPGSSTSPHLSKANSSINLSNLSPPFLPTMTNPINNNSIRHPPPRYKSPTSNIAHSHSTLLSTNDSSTSNQQSKTTNNNTNSPAGFDREFSRLLYGKDAGKIRRLKHKRKAFSDPVKKSVEEASRSVEKNHRRVTTHVNKTDTFTEEDDDDDNDETETETETERSNSHTQDSNFLPRRRFQRQSDLLEKNRESAKKAIVPANPLLKRRIPSFLRVYSQASSSNDILLQWHLFNLSELESFYAMMSRLYKNENLARVQLYEIYRTALNSTLVSKRSSTTDDENDAITTPL